ncbi:MAG: primary-amine oxidase [Actinobacteria bacterium]|nr:primary-amine oxidase [Actinomycetota bacterium]
MRAAHPHTSRMTPHPLDPLAPEELAEAIAILRREQGLTRDHLFVFTLLDEPSKEALSAWSPGDPIDRAARITVWDRAQGLLIESVVGLDGTVRRWDPQPGQKAAMLGPEAVACLEAARNDPRVIEGLRRRGIDDPSQVHMETWPFGIDVPEHLNDGRRLIWTPMWHRPTPDANQYAHPIGGLHAVVAVDTAEVVDVEDTDGIPTPQTPGPYRLSETGGGVRLKPLEIIQPEGASFEVDGWEIRWERWRFRLGHCQREGLVIHDVRFDDDGTERTIARRMSIAELVIPYGDTGINGAARKAAFDTGEFGFGNYANSLTLGCDCLGEIVYLDVCTVDAEGEVHVVQNGICLHEEDFGVLWKHTDTDGHVEVRRGRRFVASQVATIDNYEYGYFWYFHQDGTIEFEAKLTGIVLTRAGVPGAKHPSSTEIEPGLLAPYHQHLFCARLDLDVDGPGNTVIEVDAVAQPMGPANPDGNAYTIRETTLASEARAQRDIDPFAGRYWKVVNPSSTNHLGKPRGYKLLPTGANWPLADPESVIGRRARFMYHHLWVTPNRPDELYPAGDHPFQHEGLDGLPRWTAADRPLEDTDVVLWFTFGTNHIPRTEDWPVMPVERTGFMLKPYGFFARSPGIDVAPSEPKHCC